MSRKFREWKAYIKFYHTEEKSSLASYRSYKRVTQKNLKEDRKYEKKMGISCSVYYWRKRRKNQRKSEKIGENRRRIVAFA